MDVAGSKCAAFQIAELVEHKQRTPGTGPDWMAGVSVPSPIPSQVGATPPPQPKIIELSFAADRNQLYAAWQALANLADLCGTVTLSIKGETPQNLDKSKLENGVYEPLREANLID
jgi:hypothetical protein